MFKLPVLKEYTCLLVSSVVSKSPECFCWNAKVLKISCDLYSRMIVMIIVGTHKPEEDYYAV